MRWEAAGMRRSFIDFYQDGRERRSLSYLLSWSESPAGVPFAADPNMSPGDGRAFVPGMKVAGQVLHPISSTRAPTVG
jgi:hypothetical protein